MNRPCIGCKYFEACGDKKRTESCKGAEYTEQFKEFIDNMVKAHDEDDFETLERMTLAHHDWFIVGIDNILYYSN